MRISVALDNRAVRSHRDYCSSCVRRQVELLFFFKWKEILNCLKISLRNGREEKFRDGIFL